MKSKKPTLAEKISRTENEHFSEDYFSTVAEFYAVDV